VLRVNYDIPGCVDETDKNHENSKSGEPVLRPRFNSRTSQIRTWRANQYPAVEL